MTLCIETHGTISSALESATTVQDLVSILKRIGSMDGNKPGPALAIVPQIPQEAGALALAPNAMTYMRFWFDLAARGDETGADLLKAACELRAQARHMVSGR